MKQIYLLLIVLLGITLSTFSQSVGINNDGSAPNPNAMLDIKAKDKGLLIPRTSTTTRLTIPSTKGLLVYDTTSNSFWYNDGNAWNNLAGGGTGWSLTGNSGTDTSVNFIGTTDAKPLVIKLNHTIAGFIDNSSNGNTGLGYQTFLSNTTGNGNTATGSSALSSNTTGLGNSAFGDAALNSNISSSYNTAVGGLALYGNTTGSSNTATGAFSLGTNTTGNNNTANGFSTLNSNTTGYSNTATGSLALSSNTTGYQNTANGDSALYNNTEGIQNIASGYLTLFNSTTGYRNVAIGNSTLYDNIDGHDNVALGSVALNSNISGMSNTACGTSTMALNTTGDQNTALGYGALSTNRTGKNNTAIGYHADVNYSNLSNATAIGANAYVNTSNTIKLGDDNITDVFTNNNCNIHAGLVTTSDARLKNTIMPLTLGLQFISMLKPVTYLYNDQHNEHLHCGFLAQDVEKAATQLGTSFSGVYKPKTDKDYYGLSYQDFIMPLVNAVKELKKENEGLKKELNDLSERVALLEKNASEKNKP